MTANMETTHQVINELERFQQVFDHHLEEVNKTDYIEKSISDGLNRRAKNLYHAAARILPAGKNKDQILRHLTWCIKDTQSWADSYSNRDIR